MNKEELFGLFGTEKVDQLRMIGASLFQVGSQYSRA